MPIDSATRSCGHTIFRHLFYNIRCPQQPLTHKATLIASAILLISGLAWKGWSSYQHSQARRRKDAEPPRPPSPNLEQPTLEWRDYPPEGRAAIAFAKQKLSEKAGKVEKLAQALQEESPNWPFLINKYLVSGDEGCWAQFYDLVLKVPLDATEAENTEQAQKCWQNRDLIQLMDEYMQVAYAVSCLALEQIPEISKNDKRIPKTLRTDMEKRVWVVVDQDYRGDRLRQHYKHWFTCPSIYNRARMAFIYGESKKNRYIIQYPVPVTHSESFYLVDTPQSRWRALYNDYCDRTKMYLNMDMVRDGTLNIRGDSRHYNWTHRDDNIDFQICRDTVPT